MECVRSANAAHALETRCNQGGVASMLPSTSLHGEMNHNVRAHAWLHAQNLNIKLTASTNTENNNLYVFSKFSTKVDPRDEV